MGRGQATSTGELCRPDFSHHTGGPRHVLGRLLTSDGFLSSKIARFAAWLSSSTSTPAREGNKRMSPHGARGSLVLQLLHPDVAFRRHDVEVDPPAVHRHRGREYTW